MKKLKILGVSGFYLFIPLAYGDGLRKIIQLTETVGNKEELRKIIEPALKSITYTNRLALYVAIAEKDCNSMKSNRQHDTCLAKQVLHYTEYWENRLK